MPKSTVTYWTPLLPENKEQFHYAALAYKMNKAPDGG